jgi:P-type Ca2+ transporter type 2C
LGYTLGVINSAHLSDPHAKNADDVIVALGSSRESGLTDNEVVKRHEQFGRNVLPQAKRKPAWMIFLTQFKSTIVYILVIAAVISFLYDHLLDAYIIAGIILVNAIVGFFQEFQAEKSIEALKKLIIPQTQVKRNGKLVTVSSHELVPGDIIVCDEGDHVPADARLFKVTNAQVDESSLTGESLPVHKTLEPVEENTPLAERTPMVWMGSLVVAGSFEAVVVHIGTQTMLGGIAKNLTTITEEIDHFKVKADELGKHMGLMAVASTILIFLIGFFVRDFGFEEIFMFSIATLVSAMPEGLPVILTVVLALSAKRMAKRNAIVRRLSATETLAVVDTIVTDKTGTLTQNVMSVTAIGLPYQVDLVIEMEDESPQFIQGDTKPTIEHYPLQKILDIAGSCHAVKREFASDGTESYDGDPTEIALVTLADRAVSSQLYYQEKIQQIADVPFNQENKWRASLVEYAEGGQALMAVGSPETILAASSQILLPDHKIHALDEDRYAHIQEHILRLTQQGMRVLALTYKDTEGMESLVSDDVHSMVFVGLVGIIDPPRPETKAAVMAATKAGIQVIMATGDHPVTARAIGEQLGLITSDEQKVITQVEFDAMSDQELGEIMDSTFIFARMTPSAKLRLASVLQDNGRVVAMTGDGVNDAPALKKADIGISMGKNGTDVAREASDIILTDDNFATIISAVEEGRTQLRNVRRTSFFYVTTNVAATLTLTLFLLLGLPLPLLPKQILWLNLVTAGITDIALATEPMHDDVLSARPRKKSEPILNKQVLPFLLTISLAIVLLAMFFFLWYHSQGLIKARTMLFVVLSATQIYNMFNMRSIKKSIFKLGFFSSKNINIAMAFSFLMLFLVIYMPGLNTIFGFEPLPFIDLVAGMMASLVIVVVGEGYKVWQAKRASMVR